MDDDMKKETLETPSSTVHSHDSEKKVDDSSKDLPSPVKTLDDPSKSPIVPAESSELSPYETTSTSDGSDFQIKDYESHEEYEPLPLSTLAPHWAEPWNIMGYDKYSSQSLPPAPVGNLPVDWSYDPEINPHGYNFPDLDDIWPRLDVYENKPSLEAKETLWTDDFLRPVVKRSSWDEYGSGHNNIGNKRPVAGLSNLGHTCFLNTILQCFMHTVPLIQGLRAFNHEPCDWNIDKFCVLCAFRDLLIKASVNPGVAVVSPHEFFDNLNYFSSGFRKFEQEDAQEFLQCFLDRLESCCNNILEMSCTSSQDDNIIKQVFGGLLVSKLSCCSCNHCSDTYEPSKGFSLGIDDVSTLQRALELFTKVEKLETSHDIKFKCENCNEEVFFDKQLLIKEAPSVAALHLKRFKNDGTSIEKISMCVKFPLELDLEPYTSSSTSTSSSGSQTNHDELKYNLYAVVVHVGSSITFGHYYCFICYAPDTWYKFEDAQVSRVGQDLVLSEEAYILFYAKKGTPWFSDFFEAQAVSNRKPENSDTSPKSVADKNNSSNNDNPGSRNNNVSDVDLTEASNQISGEGFSGSRNDNQLTGNLEEDKVNVGSKRVCGPLSLYESNPSCGTPFQVDKDNSAITTSMSPRSSTPNTPKEDLPSEVGLLENTPNRERSVDQVKNILEEDPERKTSPTEGTHKDSRLNIKKKNWKESARKGDKSPLSSRKNPSKFSPMSFR